MKLHRLTVVVNPTSGKKRGLVVLDRVKPIFKDAGIELDVRATQHHGHASEVARTVDLKTTDGICVIGGVERSWFLMVRFSQTRFYSS